MCCQENRHIPSTYAVQGGTLQSSALHFSVVQCSPVKCSQLLQCSASQDVVQCYEVHTIRCSAIQHSAVSAVECGAVECSAVECSAVECGAVRYAVCGWGPKLAVSDGGRVERTDICCPSQSPVSTSVLSMTRSNSQVNRAPILVGGGSVINGAYPI